MLRDRAASCVFASIGACARAWLAGRNLQPCCNCDIRNLNPGTRLWPCAGVLALAAAHLRSKMGHMLIATLLSAPIVLAQTGGGKTAIGWLIVLLCIGLGLLVVCRPSARKSPLKR